MERNILIEYGIQKINSSEQFEIISQCTYRKWLYLATENDKKIKYYAILLSERPLEIADNQSSSIYFTGFLPHFLLLNVLYLSKSFDDAVNHSFEYAIPINKSFISSGAVKDEMAIIIEYNQFRFTLLGEAPKDKDTKELNIVLTTALETSKEIEKCLKNNCIDTNLMIQHYKSMGNDQFTKSTTEKFKSMFPSANNWKGFTDFKNDFKKAKKYYFNSLEGMLCKINNFNIKMYQTFANIGLLCLMTKMEEFWEIQNDSKPLSWADTDYFLKYLTKFNRKLKQFYLYDEKIDNSFTNLIITSVRRQSNEVINALDSLIEIHIKLSSPIKQIENEIYQLQNPCEILERIKIYASENIKFYFEQSNEDYQSVKKTIILKSLFQRSLYIIHQYIKKMKGLLSKNISDEIIIAIINQDKSLKTIIKDLSSFIESFKVLENEKIDKVINESKIYDQIRSIRKLFEIEYCKRKLENLKNTKMNQPFETIEIEKLLNEGNIIFNEVNHHLNTQNSMYMYYTFMKQLADYYVYWTILAITERPKASQIIFKRLDKDIDSFSKNLKKKEESELILGNCNSLYYLVFAGDASAVIKSGVEIIKLLKDNSKNDTSLKQIKILLNCRSDREILNFKEVMEQIQLEKQKLDNEIINPLTNEEEEEFKQSFSLSKFFVPEKFELVNNEVKILQEKVVKILEAEAETEKQTKSFFGMKVKKNITKFHLKLTYETLNLYANPADLKPIKFINLLEIKEIMLKPELNEIVITMDYTSKKTGSYKIYSMKIMSSTIPIQEWMNEIQARTQNTKTPNPIKWNKLIFFKMIKASNQFHFEAFK